MNLNDPLTKDDIELRIANTSQKGFSLLLYKTARTDVKRLDECYPMKWKNRFFYDNKGLLCCEISIYNDNLKEWVSRSDVGTESFTEKEKGSYSDAFKRAGFKWNIGTELYYSPFIWINWEMIKNGNSYKPKNFFPSNLEVVEFGVEHGKVTRLVINYNGSMISTIFNYGVKTQPPKQETKHPQQLNEAQILMIEGLIKEAEANRDDLLHYFKVSKIEDLSLENYNKAVALLNSKKAKLSKAKKG